jgi:hypothetical protein
MDLSALSATDLSAAGLLALAVLLILWGRLVPKSVVEDIRTDRDNRLAESKAEIEDWKSAFQAAEESRALQGHQIGELLELAKTTDAFIRSLQTAAQRNP